MTRTVEQLISILDEVDDVMNDLRQMMLAKGENRSSGYFVIFDSIMRFPLMITMIGDVPKEKLEKYFTVAMEKATRLTDNPDHRSSWQSRNPEEGEWGGAIRVGDLIFSFSGLPESVDETFNLEVAVSAGLLTEEEALGIASISNNGDYADLQGYRM